MTDEQYERLRQICSKRGIALPPNPGPLVLMDPNVVERAYRDVCRFSSRAVAVACAISDYPVMDGVLWCAIQSSGMQVVHSARQ